MPRTPLSLRPIPQPSSSSCRSPPLFRRASLLYATANALAPSSQLNSHVSAYCSLVLLLSSTPLVAQPAHEVETT